MKIPTNKKKEKGFTLIELLIVLVVIGVMVAIAVPNLIDYYWQQRFSQEVQRVVATVRRSQFAAVSMNQWIGMAMHSRCPVTGQGDKFCTQLFRIPLGSCMFATWPAGGSQWLNYPQCDETNIATLCEYKAERWIMESVVRPEPDLPGDVIYVIGANGSISSQNGAPPTSPICSDLPVPPPSGSCPTTNLCFSFRQPDSPSGYQYKGVCITGRGNVRASTADDWQTYISCESQ